MLALCGCVREPAQSAAGTEEGEGVLQMSFGSVSPVEIETRATLGEVDECQINNFYVFIFHPDGRIAGSQFFDSRNRKTGKELVTSSLNSSWYVSNATGTSSRTTGVFRIKSGAGTGLRVYMIANLDEDIFNVSSGMLSHAVQTETDLLHFAGELRQFTVDRSGYLTMTGVAENVTIAGSDDSKSVAVSECTESISLRRMTAKVRFIFKTGDRPDEKGNVISSFRPGKWKVVNVPKSSYLLSYAERGVNADSGEDASNPAPSISRSEYQEWAGDFFNTDFAYFEDMPSTGQSEFSFYMMENSQTPKKACASYQDRSRCLKDASGHNVMYTVDYDENGAGESRKMRIFEYANDFSTYVVVTGSVEMKLKNDPEGTVLGGDVQYIIHLGDWSSSIDGSSPEGKNDKYSGFDNFNVERNTSYTYTVTVNSVNSISVEVNTGNDDSQDFEERQPGATGDITIAKEEIAICDSHYSSRSFSFSLDNFFDSKGGYIGDLLTWFVETPFSSGGPEKGLDNLDYQWVHFRLNKPDSNGNYSDARRKYTPRQFVSYYDYRSASENREDDGSDGLAGYHNDGAMTVQQLVEYVKGEVAKYREGKVNAFDHKSSSSIKDKKIKVTAFIDEYYYDKEPVRPYNASPALWKRFVNQADRKMHILSNSEMSLDRESMVTGSVVTIQQKSIVSIYSTDESKASLTTAWGAESVDEFEGTRTYWSSTEAATRGNESFVNGLRNSCVEWGLCGDWNNKFIEGVHWSEYMDFERPDGTTLLNDEHNYLRYACMERNRDNNGDGIIDRSEIRWYLASIDQLVGLFVGNDVLSEDVRLYNRAPDDRNSDDVQKWQQHVISSTRYSWNGSNNPTIVWAEEGISTGATYPNVTPDYQQIKKANIRCVRNLGHVSGNADNTYPVNETPQNHIVMSETGDGNYLFSAEFLNSMAIRYYTSNELSYSDETSVANRVYSRFEAYKEASSLGKGMRFEVYNSDISRYAATGRPNPYCPDGYRTPNQMEVAIMRYYLPNVSYTTPSRTFWSLGKLGENHSGAGSRYGFIQNDAGHVTVDDKFVSQVRCVRDVR